ncbi:hypothetical protein C8Q74DRAFT_1260381 [Fomes fomentarius]|nr:hypothetical protein C8Q74DRAFT_1260381 [Fomes fomentarius]
MGITWYSTYTTSREVRLLGESYSVSWIMFRDGAIYFVVLVAMNSLSLSFATFFSVNLYDWWGHLDGNGRDVRPSSLTYALSLQLQHTKFLYPSLIALLISRFCMDLQ